MMLLSKWILLRYSINADSHYLTWTMVKLKHVFLFVGISLRLCSVAGDSDIIKSMPSEGQ